MVFIRVITINELRIGLDFESGVGVYLNDCPSHIYTHVGI